MKKGKSRNFNIVFLEMKLLNNENRHKYNITFLVGITLSSSFSQGG